MKLYVCYGDWKPAPRPGGHPCGTASHALKDAGYEPELINAYGLAILPEFFNRGKRRQEVKRLSPDGNVQVPLLQTDDGKIIQGSREIAAWAKANPAGAKRAAA